MSTATGAAASSDAACVGVADSAIVAAAQPVETTMVSTAESERDLDMGAERGAILLPYTLRGGSDVNAHDAPTPARGRYANGFESVAKCFAAQLASGQEVGASLSVYHRGQHVVDLWGGLADVATRRAWECDTRIVLFSVTKGFAAMAMHMLADNGQFDWDDPVAAHWPGFAAHGKAGITIRTLMSHRAGIPYLDIPLSLMDCVEPDRAAKVTAALEAQVPLWPPGSRQAYHAVTFGLYVHELFTRIAKEPMGSYLKRELFDVVGSDARLGTPASEDAKQATLYAPSVLERATKLIVAAATSRMAPEVLIAKSLFGRGSVSRLAFSNPTVGRRGPLAFNDIAIRRAALAWASATASADGVARAYLPFAAGSRAHGARSLFRPESLLPLEARQSWSESDETLKKPLGWSQGFLKEERHVFSPNPESFGHAGMGGSLGWCDPKSGLAFGYVTNRMDPAVRSPRCLALCHSLYDCPPLCEERS
ncbi:MAG: class A beta-lactamase-related serine hydrolase [Myxococcales bacterium]|nr:class A beta-lactamase-related serine hydrolase [Myxococcales bacterium]